MSDQVVLEEVSKTFSQGGEETHALRSVSLSVNLGELLMLVGPSGSGKTTLMSVIAGTLAPDSGSVSLFGYPLSQKTQEEACEWRKKNIGFIFQHFHLIPTLTCLENVAIPLLLCGEKRGQAFSQAAKILKKVGLESKISHSPKKLSGGQQQRVAIARALVHDPKLVICDEPTSSLDKETGKQVIEMIHDLATTKNRAVVVVTHDPRIFEYAHRTLEMNDGKLVETKC